MCPLWVPSPAVGSRARVLLPLHLLLSSPFSPAGGRFNAGNSQRNLGMSLREQRLPQSCGAWVGRLKIAGAVLDSGNRVEGGGSDGGDLLRRARRRVRTKCCVTTRRTMTLFGCSCVIDSRPRRRYFYCSLVVVSTYSGKLEQIKTEGLMRLYPRVR